MFPHLHAPILSYKMMLVSVAFVYATQLLYVFPVRTHSLLPSKTQLILASDNKVQKATCFIFQWGLWFLSECDLTDSEQNVMLCTIHCSTVQQWYN